MRDLIGSGRFWMAFWLVVFVVALGWAVATVLWWSDSTRNVNMLSVAALILAPAAGFQACLSMRKADPADPL